MKFKHKLIFLLFIQILDFSFCVRMDIPNNDEMLPTQINNELNETQILQKQKQRILLEVSKEPTIYNDFSKVVQRSINKQKDKFQFIYPSNYENKVNNLNFSPELNLTKTYNGISPFIDEFYIKEGPLLLINLSNNDDKNNFNYIWAISNQNTFTLFKSRNNKAIEDNLIKLFYKNSIEIESIESSPCFFINQKDGDSVFIFLCALSQFEKEEWIIAIKLHNKL